MLSRLSRPSRQEAALGRSDWGGGIERTELFLHNTLVDLCSALIDPGAEKTFLIGS